MKLNINKDMKCNYTSCFIIISEKEESYKFQVEKQDSISLYKMSISYTWTVFWNLSVMAFLKSSADAGSSDLISWYLSSRSDQSFITWKIKIQNLSWQITIWKSFKLFCETYPKVVKFQIKEVNNQIISETSNDCI